MELPSEEESVGLEMSQLLMQSQPTNIDVTTAVSMFKEYYEQYKRPVTKRGPDPANWDALNFGFLLKKWGSISKEDDNAMVPFVQITTRCKFFIL
jgi:hypothetical protein